MLMSMIAAPRCSLSLAASAITCGSQPGELHRHRLLDRVPHRLLQRLAGLAHHRLAGDHLADRQPRAVALDHAPERQIGDARHRRQDHRRCDLDRADRDGLQHLHERRAFTGAPGEEQGARAMSVTALIVAAGKGERLGGGVPKQYRPLGGKPVLRWAVEALLAPSRDQRRPGGDWRRARSDLPRTALAGLDVGGLIHGGAERADSVRAGLAAIDGDAVLVHDAARPFCPPAVIDRLLAPARILRRRGAGSAGRRHARARGGRPRANPSTATAWSASRPRRPSGSTASAAGLCRLVRRRADRRDHGRSRGRACASPRSRAIRRSTS